MSGGKIDHPSAAKEAARAACDFPRLVQLLTRQAPGVADGARDAIEQRVAGKAIEIAIGQPSARRRRENRQASVIQTMEVGGGGAGLGGGGAAAAPGAGRGAGGGGT